MSFREAVFSERQWAWPVLAVWPLVAGLCLWQWPQATGRFDQAALLVLLTAGVALCLGCLQTEVGSGELRWGFGWPGFPSWKLALGDIAKVEICRSRWHEGWGLRHTREGWLYNVWGFDTVRVTRRDGRSFRLGSADASALQRALASRLHA